MKKVIFGVVSMLLLTIMLMLAFNTRAIMSSEPPATEWSRTYGGIGDDVGWSVIQTSDGGYAIAGWTESSGSGNEDVWLIKTDASGNAQWNRTYGSTVWERGYCLIQTCDGGYAIAGETRPSATLYSNRDFWLVKTDADGNMLWNKTCGGTDQEEAYSVVQTNDGGYVIAGRTLSFGAGWEDVWLVRTDQNGNMQWNKTFGGSDGDFAYSVVQTSDGGYAISGETSVGFDQRNFWLIKTDANGTMQWDAKYGGDHDARRAKMVQTTDGGYVLGGLIGGIGAGGGDFWLVKTDASGNMLWNKTYGGTNADYACSVVQTVDGGYVLAGETLSFGAGSWDYWLVKTDENGNIEWNQTYGGTNEENPYCVIQTGDGGYALIGYTESFGAGNYDFWFIKLAPERISAAIDIDPDTLNLKSNGQWITAYITLPDRYNVEDIVLETVKINDISAAWSDIQNGVYMAKFDRATVQTYLTNEPDYESAPKFYDITLTVTGGLTDGTVFEGTDTITVIKK